MVSASETSSILSLAVMLVLLHSSTTKIVPPTFMIDDPIRGNSLTCNHCPPGTYMGAYCTATEDTVCLPCPAQHFTEFWNYLPKCLYCTNLCDENQIVKEECSPTKNAVCECKKGYYWHGDFCVKHTQCSSGFGAKQIGTVHRNTECEKCPRGTFSAESSSRAQCLNHTDCGPLLVAIKGTSWHDNVCLNCTDLRDGGKVALLRSVLPGFFASPKLKKMRRFVRLLESKTMFNGRSALSHNAKHNLLSFVTDWIKTAEEHQLEKLPVILRKSGLQFVAVKIEKMLKKLERLPCTATRSGYHI